ncbi:urease accessory protein [Desulfuromusa kysingii]|uniref:Urease accessory protein n=1 Tax=Desulfuromusa kysingii TaxID=37625 RepID=A0A1H4CSR0_9BACT|nr:HupE/UreJ family protein [Desulfuromusa kysingii]SEA63152.1 urease accessory protein [Desulfuromusa kysingii]
MQHLIGKTLLLLLVLPSLVLAHTGAGEATGFIYGFNHPIGGVDHLLAMIAVGLWAVQMGGRSLWVVPSTFVAVMLLGGVLGFSGVSVPFIEEGILVSILIFGVLIAGAFRFPLLYSSIIVGFFALLHGHAHGAEMPVALGAGSYAIGFALATAILHVTGMGIGGLMQKANLQTATRFAGGVVALSGLYLAFI